jgi:hypothetical protein
MRRQKNVPIATAIVCKSMNYKRVHQNNLRFGDTIYYISESSRVEITENQNEFNDTNE